MDAVRDEIDLHRDLGQTFVDERQLFTVQTEARDKSEYLLRPDRGRRLNDAARQEIVRRCPAGAELQFVIGDGLSATAVARQVPQLLPLLEQSASQSGLRAGQTLLVRYCRVGVMNDIGELLDPAVVVLLIGERPGLAAADSLSAYMAYRPRTGDTDARRNLISNIHSRGLSPEHAAGRILRLAAKMIQHRQSGFAVKEDNLKSEIPNLKS
jgi:ethanolamine ammonia-lyase small subunit